MNGVGEGGQSTEANATPTAPPALLTADFETGTHERGGWTVSRARRREHPLPHADLETARDQCASSACWAYRPFTGGQTATDLWIQAWVFVGTATRTRRTCSSSERQQRLRGGRVRDLPRTTAGKISSTGTTSQQRPSPEPNGRPTGGWHAITVHLTTGTTGHVDVWLDGTPQTALSQTDNLGTAAIGKLQLGENSSGRKFDVRYDDITASKAAIAP